MVNSRFCFWFGTEEKMQWFATPLQGADSSPTSWGVDGTLLNGGGYGFHAWGSHKRYTYEWPQSSSPETAQKMRSYRDGTYGRGLLYFIEPTIFEKNILPASWAAPSMAIDSEAATLVYNVEPSGTVTSGSAVNDLPVETAVYNLSGVPARTTADKTSSLFVPIPDGYTLHLGAFYSATGAGGVFVTPVNPNGTDGTTVPLTPISNSSPSVVADSFTGLRGVRLWVGRSASIPSTVSIAAMIGRLVENGRPAPFQGPWMGGMGHSGCRFLGTPSYVTNSPIDGGRVGFAASFVEVGNWAFG